MILVERGEVRLNDSVVKFIPEMKGDGRDAITSRATADAHRRFCSRL